MASTNDEKIITQEVFEQSLKDILQTIADHCYDWQEYTDSEVSDILEISDTQAIALSKIINDNMKATNKLWSSAKVDEAIQSATVEANQYAEQLIGNISSISLEYVTALPTVGEGNIIYILSGTPNTLNVYNQSTSAFVTVGDLDVDMSTFYTKNEVDTLLDDKANKDEVFDISKVVDDLSTVSNDTVLSTTGLKTELDNKLGTTGDTKDTTTTFTSGDSLTDISAWTNIALMSSGEKQSDLLAKLSTAVKNLRYLNSLAGNDDISEIGTSLTNAITELYNTFDIYQSIYQSSGYNKFSAVPINVLNETFFVNIGNTADDTSPYPSGTNMIWNCIQFGYNGKISQLAIQTSGTNANEVWFRNRGTNGWDTWYRVCNTSVADVGWTEATCTSKVATGGGIYYRVKNGVCFVNCLNIASATMSTSNEALANGLPKPEISAWYAIGSNDSAYPIQVLLVNVNSTGELINYIGSNGAIYYGSFSYPVANS